VSRPDAATEPGTDAERDASLSVAPAPDRDEAAAVAAAVGAYLADERLAAAARGTDDDPDDGRAARWRLAGRHPAADRRPVRPREGAPADPWTAAGRRDRR
jgi:hypothetical protein